MLAVELDLRFVTRVTLVMVFLVFKPGNNNKNSKIMYTEGSIIISTSSKVCPLNINNFHLKEIHVHVFWEDMFNLVKFSVIDKSVYNTGFKIFNNFKSICLSRNKKIRCDLRYINYFVSSAGVHFPWMTTAVAMEQSIWTLHGQQNTTGKLWPSKLVLCPLSSWPWRTWWSWKG